MFGAGYFGPRYFGERYFAAGTAALAEVRHFGSAYFGVRYFGPRYFGPGQLPIVQAEEAVATGGWPLSYDEWLRRRYPKEPTRKRPKTRIVVTETVHTGVVEVQPALPPERTPEMRDAIDRAQAAMAPPAKGARRRQRLADDDWFILMM